MRRTILEICVETVAEAEAALGAGADRLEVCASLEVEGLTPAPDLVRDVVRMGAPVIAMVRDRAGPFTAEDSSVDAMVRAARALRGLGVRGLAFGVLTPDRKIDARAMERLVEATGGADGVCHRAFDAAADLNEAARVLRSLGVRRVLTSGGAPSAREGAGAIAALRAAFAGGPEFVPAGGVRAGGVREILAVTGCREVHAGCRRPAGPGRRVLDAREVGMLRAAIDGAAGDGCAGGPGSDAG